MIKRTRKSGPPTFDDISRRAYEIFVQRGRPSGQDLEHWLQAESELKSASVRPPVARADSGLRRVSVSRKPTASSSMKSARRERGNRRTGNS
jgi:hypothetical protein